MKAMSIVYKIGGVLLVISLAVAYYYYTQNKIDTLTHDVESYKGANEQSTKVINALKINSREQVKQYNQLSERLKYSQQENDRLNKLFSDHNLTELSYKKPGLIEKRINNATDKVFENINKLTSDK